MSNLWFNIRFGIRHFQWGPDGVSFKVNQFYKEVRPAKWFEIYTLFGICFYD